MIIIDVHEPSQAVSLISQSVPCKTDSLNEQGFADYLWETYDGSRVQVERKQWGEVLAGIDSVEDQLRRQAMAKNSPRLLFFIEGMITPHQFGTTILKSTSKNAVWVGGYQSSTKMSQVFSWLYEVSKYLEVFQTTSYEATCIALVSMYKHDQKTDHHTFNRYFKPMTFNPNPQVVGLMGLMPGVGEKRAQALIQKFTTVYNVVTASPEELATVDGIGKSLSVTLLQRAGRPDV